MKPPQIFQVVGEHSFSSVQFKIGVGESILGGQGRMLFRSGDLKVDVKTQGLGKALIRGLSGAGLVINEFSGQGEQGGAISFGGVSPGGMVLAEVKKETPLVLSRNSFVCCDSDIEIGGQLNIRGLFEVGQEEGFLLPRAVLRNEATSQSGRIWLSAFGQVQQHEVPEGKSFWVDNGCFVACTVRDPSKPPYHVDTAVNGLWKSFLSGEGFAMRFEGPLTVWTQNRNLNDFAVNVARLSGAGENNVVDNVETGVSVVEGLSKLFSGGRPLKTAPKASKAPVVPKPSKTAPKPSKAPAVPKPSKTVPKTSKTPGVPKPSKTVPKTSKTPPASKPSKTPAKARGVPKSP